MTLKRALALVACLVIGSGSAHAQSASGNEFVTTTQGKNVVGTVAMCLNSSNQAVPESSGTCASSSTGSSITSSVAGSAASSLVIKASAGNLYSAYAVCTAACWLMVFNATSAPADGATTAGTASGNLQDCVPIAAGGTGGVSYGSGPAEAFSAGITAVISSTACATKTAATTGFIHGTAR